MNHFSVLKLQLLQLIVEIQLAYFMMKKALFGFILSLSCAALYVKKFIYIDVEEVKCLDDLIKNISVCTLTCPHRSFALPGMLSCHPWLNCEAEITLISLISASVVKTVYLANWNGYKVVLSVLSAQKFEEDFLHNLFMIKSLSPNDMVVQLLGYCENSLLTKYYELGSALNLHYHFEHSLKAFDNLKTRLSLCINYVSIIKYLHNSPVGVRVMCDSNTLDKTLSQYLLTNDLKLVVNDLDATPLVDTSKGIHCGSQEVNGKLVAPEQIWPYPEKEFDINQMPLYDEKVDIFKIPDVCNWFLGYSSDNDIIKYKLFSLHKTCKSIYPSERPTLDNIIGIYKKVFHDIL